MSVIVIANCSASKKYYEEDYPKIIKELNLKPIFMYYIDYSNNSTLNFNTGNNKTLYEELIVYSHKDKEGVLNLLKSIPSIVAFIPYTEDDVIDSEFFSYHFGTPSNPVKSSICRRDKYEMQEKIKNFGIKNITQKRCSNISDVVEFFKKNQGIKYVIKPVTGAASEDVYLCDNLDDLCNKFELIINKINNCDLINSDCLVQEYIDGEDWIVNSVSRNGIHKIVNVMKSYKSCINGRHFMYSDTALIDPINIPIELCVYAINVLNALDFKNGAGHSEIKLSSKGPCLIEIGARVGGGQNEEAVGACVSSKCGQLKSTIFSYCDFKLFTEIPVMYSSTNYKYKCITINCLYDSLTWNENNMKVLVENLNLCVRVHKVICPYKNGDNMCKTQDLLTIIARIFVTSEDEEMLKKALSLVKKWEIELN
jgi:hypothetical protein